MIRIGSQKAILYPVILTGLLMLKLELVSQIDSQKVILELVTLTDSLKAILEPVTQIGSLKAILEPRIQSDSSILRI